MRNPPLKLFLMMHKIVSELIIHARDDWRNLKNKKWRPTENTSGVRLTKIQWMQDLPL